jgi:cytochrome c-type biogenesis protein CcmH/NrfG
MLMFDGVFGLVLLGLWIFCIIDVITTPAERCRNLPKVVWVLIVLLFTFVGSIVWLVAGRSWDAKQPTLRAPAARPARPTNPDDDEEFLAQLRARAEEQRRRARRTEPGEDEPPRTVS